MARKARYSEKGWARRRESDRIRYTAMRILRDRHIVEYYALERELRQASKVF